MSSQEYDERIEEILTPEQICEQYLATVTLIASQSKSPRAWQVLDLVRQMQENGGLRCQTWYDGDVIDFYGPKPGTGMVILARYRVKGNSWSITKMNETEHQLLLENPSERKFILPIGYEILRKHDFFNQLVKYFRPAGTEIVNTGDYL